LFSQSNGEQKAGILNQLIASVGPGTLAQLAGGGALASLLGGGSNALTPNKPKTYHQNLCSRWRPMPKRQILPSSIRRVPSMRNTRLW
jgi:hypothetical protein